MEPLTDPLVPTANSGGSTNLRPFPKGVSGNPVGRPKGTAALAQRIRRETKDGKTLVEYLLRAVEHSRSPKERLDACALLLAYGFGKPVQPTEDVTPGGAGQKLQVQIVHVHEHRGAA